MIVTTNHIIDPSRIVYAVRIYHAGEYGVRVQVDGAPNILIAGKDVNEVWEALKYAAYEAAERDRDARPSFTIAGKPLKRMPKKQNAVQTP